MACLSVDTTPISPAETVVAAVAVASANVAVVEAQTEASIALSPVAVVDCHVQPSAVSTIALTDRMAVNISEACAIGSGEPCVLAASVNITPIRPAATVVAAVASASADVAVVGAQTEVSIALSPVAVAVVDCHVQPSAVSTIALTDRMVVDISEVCAIGSGELCVLAASDGILRTREGGFFLLDPAREEPEA